MIDSEPNDDVLQGWVQTERIIWAMVNQERYRVFEREWKDFYLRWKGEEFWEWPTGEEFMRQHERVLNAAFRYELPPVPIDEAGKNQAWETGISRAALRSGREEAKIRNIAPPRKRMLP